MRRIYTHVGTVEALRKAFNHPKPLSRANHLAGCVLFGALGLVLVIAVYFA